MEINDDDDDDDDGYPAISPPRFKPSEEVAVVPLSPPTFRPSAPTMPRWCDKKINNKLTNQIKIKYRDRNIESDYHWISDYKEFNKYEIIYKISFSSDLDLLY